MQVRLSNEVANKHLNVYFGHFLSSSLKKRWYGSKSLKIDQCVKQCVHL